MTALLFNRFLRYCRNNVFLFSALIILVAAVVSVIVAIEGTAFTILQGRENNKDTECIENGQFSTMFELSDAQIQTISKNNDVKIQKNYSKDIQQDSTVIRVLKPREKIDIFIPYKGKAPENNDEIAIEQIYATEKDLDIGDIFILDGKEFTVCGIGSVPDYLHPTKSSTDVGISTDTFTWVIVSEENYESLNGFAETYTYAFVSGENTDIDNLSATLNNIKAEENGDLTSDESYVRFIESLPERYSDITVSNVISFTERKNNSRMNYEIKYAKLYRTLGFSVGIMLIVMLAFIFAIVTKNQIRNEHCIIGSLYALGVSKRTVLYFYIAPNVAISFLGGIIGLILGYMPFMTGTAIAAFHKANSFPYYEYSKTIFIFIYALIMPPLFSFLVNYVVLNGALSKPALSLIRGTYEERKNPKLNFNTNNFIFNIQIRRFLREKSTFIVFFSVLFSIVLFMLGLTTKMMIKNNEKYAEKTPYDSICVMKYPIIGLETDGEKLYIKEVSAKAYNKDISFSVVGIPQESRFYEVKPKYNLQSAVASTSLASKLNLKVGDTLTFRDIMAQNQYSVKITDIIETSANLELYMDIDCLCSLTDKFVGYYNSVIFEGEPDIEESLIYSVTYKSDIIEGIESAEISVSAFISLSYIASVIIFISTLYLIVSTMIDKSTAGISLIRVFGYRNSEIQRMYVNTIIYPVVIALLFSIPIAKIFVDKISPYIYADMTMGMFFDIPTVYYIAVFITAMALFAIILLVLTLKVKSISTSVILKTRE